MKINKFNESIRDYLKPKSEDELIKSIKNSLSKLGQVYAPEYVENFLKTKSKEELDKITSDWTPREKLLIGYRYHIQELFVEGTSKMLPFELIKVGDLLTIPRMNGENNVPLCRIKEKYTFNNRKEFNEYLKEHPSMIIESDLLKVLFRSFPNVKRNTVVVNLKFDMMFLYGGVNGGVLPYTQEEIDKNISKLKDISGEMTSRLHDDYINESIKDYLKPKSLEQIKFSLDNSKTLLPNEKLKKVIEYKILNLYTNDEIKEMINGIESSLDKLSKIKELKLSNIYTDDEIKIIINEIPSPIYRLEYVFDKKLNHLFNNNEIKKLMSNETDYRIYRTIKKYNLEHIFTDIEFQNIIKKLLPNYKLYAAINDNYPKLFKEAMEEGANMDSTSFPYLNKAIFNNNSEIVKLILDDGRIKPTHNDIINAVDIGNYEIVKLLIEDERVDPSNNNNEIFKRSIYKGHKKIAKLLLSDKRVDDKLSTIHKKYYQKELEDVNESIKDYLKPKSAEEIEKSLNGMSLYQVGKLYNKFMDRGKVSEHVIKHLPLIFQCHNEVLFNEKFALHKYVDFEYKFTNHLLNNEDDFKGYYFNLVVRKNEDSFLVRQEKDNDYVYCSFTNPQTRKREATKLKSVKEFLYLLDDLGYLNESIKDYLKPKSEEQMKKSLKTMSVEDKNKIMMDLIKKEDLKMMLFMLNSGLEITGHMINMATTCNSLSAYSLLKYIKEKRKKNK